MYKRWVIGIFAGVVVLALIVAAIWPREREPVYRGKKLSQWLDACEKERYVSLRGQQDACDALRAIGTNALPWLVKWIQYRPPEWRGRLRVVMARSHLGRRVWEGLIGPGYLEVRAETAAGIGFQVLGPQSGPAIPVLVRLLESNGNADASDRANSAFRHMGDDVVPPLLAMLTRPASSDRSEAVYCIGVIGSRDYSVARHFEPALMNALGDPDFTVREQATNALQRIRPKARGTNAAGLIWTRVDK